MVERNMGYNVEREKLYSWRQLDCCDDPCGDKEWTARNEEVKRDLRQAILKGMREHKAFQSLNSNLDKGEYRMRKEQLNRRYQVEKDERNLQECICKAEQDKCKRELQVAQEVQFAEAIKDLKEDEIRESACRKQMYACAPEIRDLEREIRRAYYAKTLFAQRLEKEGKRLEEKMREQEMHDMMLEKLEKFDAEELRKAQLDCQKKKDYYKALKNQLEDATSKMAKKAAESNRDKQMVDEIIETIRQEEIQDLMEKFNKVEKFRGEIKDYLDGREYHRERERNRMKEEDKKIGEFLFAKEEQRDNFMKAKAARDAAQAAIVAKAIERIMQDQFRAEELEELRRDLYEEELAEEIRRKEEEEKMKRYNQMMELRAAAAESQKRREEKLAAEKKEEEEFRQQLMKKFEEDDRLEQMSNQKRCQKAREHRHKVEELLIERRALKAQRREEEQLTRNCFDQESQRRQEMIDKERHKLLREHGPNILGFIPRGVIKDGAELEKLGEPFLSYYRNPPLAPDPTTIDSEPCEEEIFKTMEIPKHIKY